MRTKGVALAALSAAAAFSGGTAASACEFYRTMEAQAELFDLPDSGGGLAFALIPNAAQSCVMEEKTDGNGHKWMRLGFYTVDGVKYNVDGWVREEAISPPAPTTQLASAERSTAPIEAPAQSPTVDARAAFFAKDWRLDPARSRVNFVTIKKGSVVETHSFGAVSGEVAASGDADIKIKLESVNTGIDIRDVRMRFLLFNIDEFPEAEIAAKIDPAAMQKVWDDRQISYDLPVTLTIRGVSKDLTVPVIISRLSDDMVQVTSRQPVTVNGTDFNMADGLKKLSEAAGDIDITPSSPVTFELSFVPAA